MVGELYLKSRIVPILFHRCACSFRGNFFVIGSHARIDVRTLRAVVTIEDRFEFVVYAGEFEQGRSYHLRVASSSAEFSRFVYGLRRLTQRNESLTGADEITDTCLTVGGFAGLAHGQQVRRPRCRPCRRPAAALRTHCHHHHRRPSPPRRLGCRCASGKRRARTGTCRTASCCPARCRRRIYVTRAAWAARS